MMADTRSAPPLPPQERHAVIDDLARFLAGGPAQPLAAWETAEWDFAETVVYWQGASAWLAQRLDNSALQPPPEALASLESAAGDIRQRTRVMLAGAAELLGAFGSQGIPAMPLKGALLARRHYPDPELRALGDLDILVRRSDLPAVRRVLAALGYRFLKRSEKDETYLRGEYKPNVWAPDNVHPVEIHHRALCEYAGMLCDLTETLWRHSPVQPYNAGVECPQTDPPALLAHLSAHALADWVLGLGKLSQVNDLLLLTGSLPAESWVDFIELAAGRERFLYPALLLLERLAPGSLPQEPAARMAAALPPRLLAWCQEVRIALLFELYSDAAIRRDFDRQVYDLFARNRRDAWGAAVGMIFPPRWHARLEAYPRLVGSPFWPLAYIPLNTSRLLRQGKHRLSRRSPG